jgi:hypothetical protein
MAATTKTTIPSSRPTFVPEDLPADSRLNCLVMLAKAVSPAVRTSLIKEGHKLISSAKSMKDLGYSEKTYIDHGYYLENNNNNYRLTLEVLECDEGLYAHLLNKVSKMVTNKTLLNKDHLGIMHYPYNWVYDVLCPYDEDGVLLGRPAIAAVTNYVGVMMD